MANICCEVDENKIESRILAEIKRLEAEGGNIFRQIQIFPIIVVLNLIVEIGILYWGEKQIPTEDTDTVMNWCSLIFP